MLKITENQVRELLPMGKCVLLMRETFRELRTGAAQNQPRRRLTLPTGSTLHSLAGAWGKYFGTKVYSSNPKFGAYFFFLLFDADTALPLAQFEANYLGQIRTGAASGYATDLLAAPDASILAVIGSGFQARAQCDAVRSVRSIKEVRVWSRNEEKRKTFAREMDAVSCISAEEALQGADIIATATFSKDPVLESAWVAPGAHINAMGSNQAARRELPSDLIARADLIAVDSIEQAKIEAGDLLLAPVDWADSRIVELKNVDDRPGGSPLTIFKSIGLGVEDVAAAAYVYEQLS
ncbi:MAG TPA: ornithine cyclodeaminase family protein [Bryobacteraceae bacterium]|nr:ornithine cyclodeaminase family protein [Bryobacteraceae bacterium]